MTTDWFIGMDWLAAGVDRKKGCSICAFDVVSVWEINGESNQIVYVHLVGSSFVDGDFGG